MKSSWVNEKSRKKVNDDEREVLEQKKNLPALL